MILLSGCNPTKYVKPNELFLKKTNVKIDTRKIDKDNLESLVKQKPNKKILGLFRFHLGIYNNWPWKNGNFRENSGEAPVIYDSLLTVKTAKQLKLFANKRGYFDSKVNYSTKIHNNKIKVEYEIIAGAPYKIKSIDYVFADEEIKKSSYFILRNTIAPLRPGNTFDIDILDKQRETIKREMKNLGYYYFNKDYVKYKVDSTVGNKEIAIKLYINNETIKDNSSDTLIEKKHSKYYINDINVYLSKNFNDKNLDLFDTVSFKNITVHHEDKLKYRARMLNHAISLNKNGLYILTDQTNSYKHLTELRVFKNVNISFEDIGNKQLNANVFLTPLLKKSFSIEAIGTHNGGNLGVESNLIYHNKNIFRGGEQLTVKLNGGLEIQQLINDDQTTETNFLGIFNTLEFGPEINLEFPRFLLPISLEKFSRRSNPKTNLNFLLNVQKRPEYIRNLTQASFGYFWKESRFKRHFINPFNISIIDLQPTSSFQEQLDLETNPFILNSFQDHFITSTTYSFIYNDQRVNKAQSFNYFKLNAEFAGNTSSAFNKLTNKSFDNTETESYNIMGIRYSQFIKTDFDLRLYGQTKYSSFVKRINIGIGKPYGNLDVLPFEKSYYGGGANGIRAWQARSLGPGSLPDSLTENSLNQIGELKIEANLEYRFDITKLFEGAAFIDAGNIWILSEDESRPNAEINPDRFWDDIAMGVGVGLRLDFNFFLIRFDLAAKLKDPASATPTKIDLIWNKPTLNLGIGYPF
ncbi:BamA/TamA family outer membrane protein [Vicingaceae bacterium]|nr:BamA/TamA family outer membrane protein [Vicingaceae bacterium]